MSRAFVKEGDDDLSAGELPERPLSAHPNYVTPRGLELLHARLKDLRARARPARGRGRADGEAEPARGEARHPLLPAQLDRAIVVDPTDQPRDEVHFGATVTIVDEDGKRHAFHIVGDDEADVASGRISWASPLATAMMGAKVGDTVKWQRPAGVAEVEIVAIRYD